MNFCFNLDSITSPLFRSKWKFIMKIRKLSKKDISEVMELIKRCFSKSDAKVAKWHFEISLDKNLKKKFYHEQKYFLAIEDSKIIGISGIYSFSHHPKNTCWLGWFAVLPEYRGRGIGTKLLKYTLNWAKKKRYKFFCIETTSHKSQKVARKLYKRFGFKKVGRISDFFKIYDLLYLSKKLN